MSPTDQIFTVLKMITAFVPIQYSDANPFGVKPNDFLLGDRAAQAKNPMIGAANDYPQVRIDPKGPNQGQGAPRVFGMYSQAVDHVVPVSCNFQLIVVHRNITWDQQSSVESAVDQFLETCRATLMQLQSGVLGISSFQWTTSRVDEKSQLTGMEKRSVSRRSIVVSCRPYRSTLLT